MAHHHHQHTPDISSVGRRLFLTMGLNFLITITEVVGGILSGSLALISDALHNFSDGISVIISYIALRLKQRDFSYRHTFGLKRAEILAAIINSSVLIVISIYLFYESLLRFWYPQPIRGQMMTIVALVGLVANVLGTILLHRDSRHSMNIRSAYLHLLSDAISSVGVVLGGVAIILWNITWVDPILTILIGLYILRESFRIVAEAVHVLMEGAPTDLSLEAVKEAVEALEDVQDIHHIHVWMVGENDVHLEAHVNVRDMLISESEALREKIEHLLQEKFNIAHITLQFECNRCTNEGLIRRKEVLPAHSG